ncbi:MAG TPA: hypothetical protein GX534_08330 [Thermoanaerobacterales bacterium]|jgi:hypothetical protein|nr:hypothetical protein [Thermoanaerobacterales bacterium]
MELLTILKSFNFHLDVKPQELLNIIKEIKKIVRELKQKNPCLKNYKLMDVGFVFANKKPQMKLYFIKRSQ